MQLSTISNSSRLLFYPMISLISAFTTIYLTFNCVLTILTDYRVKRVLEFTADYDVGCAVLNDTASYNLIKDMAKLRYSKVDELCSGGEWCTYLYLYTR